MRGRWYLLILILPLIFTACDPNRVYEYNYEFEDDTWRRDQLLTYTFAVQDTTEYYNLYINVRNTNEYPYSNMYLFLTITAPNGKYSIDTVECVLADKKGKWLGKGKVNLLDNQILYKKNIIFPREGTYKVQYEQAMREEKLPSIRNVGFRLEIAERKEND